MARKSDVGILALSALITISSVALVLVGESRPDVYLSISILIYFIYTSVDYSLRIKARLRIVDVTLFAVFAAVVAIRVLMILGFIK